MANQRPFIIFSLRYSLLVSGRAPFMIGMQRSLDEYKAALFDPARMATRHYLFSRLTVPSLAMQKPVIDPTRHRLQIFTSTELPAADRAALDATVAHLPWAEVVAVDKDEDAPYAHRTLEFLRQHAGQSALYAHCRLDDDDGLSSDFLRRLEHYIRPQFVDWAVSFAYGLTGCFDAPSQSFTGFYERHRDKTAIGLASIGAFDRTTCTSPKTIKTIFDLGAHKRIDRKAPTIQDSRKMAYIRATHAYHDSKPTKRPVTPAVDIAKLAEQFPYMVGMTQANQSQAASR